MIDTQNEYQAHKHPGKFERNRNGAAEYYYEQMSYGGGDAAVTDAENEEFIGELFQVSADEAEAFELNVFWWVLLIEDEQGFVTLQQFHRKCDAVQAFQRWAGGDKGQDS